MFHTKKIVSIQQLSHVRRYKQTWPASSEWNNQFNTMYISVSSHFVVVLTPWIPNSSQEWTSTNFLERFIIQELSTVFPACGNTNVTLPVLYMDVNPSLCSYHSFLRAFPTLRVCTQLTCV